MDIQPRIRNRNALGRHVLRHRVHDCHDIGRAKKALSSWRRLFSYPHPSRPAPRRRHGRPL